MGGYRQLPPLRMPPPRDVHVRLPAEAYWKVEEFAGRSGIAINAGVRVLVERALALETGETADGSDNNSLGATALATLVAVEQTQRLLAVIIPNGIERCEALFDEAATAAQRRLLRLEQALREEAGC